MLGHCQTVQAKIRCHRTRHVIRVCTICLNYRKIRDRWNILTVLMPRSKPFSQPTRTIDPPVLSVLWLYMVDNFCDFLFAFWATKSLMKMVCRFLFRRETKHDNNTSPKTAFVSLKGSTACKHATVTHLQCTGLFQIILYIQAGSSGPLSFTEALCDRVHSTYNYCVENRKDFPTLSLFASWPGAMNNSQWLELPISRTHFHGPKDVRAIECRLSNVVDTFSHGTPSHDVLGGTEVYKECQ